jgi:hypothetical protein
MKRYLLQIIMLAFCLGIASHVFAQNSSSASSSETNPFTKGSFLLGPHIGLAAYSSAPAFGVNGEYGITQPGKAGPGTIGISGRFDYFGFSDAYWKYTWIALGAFANYHFAVSAPWDPFIGLGLGYENVSTSYEGPDGSQSLNDAGWGSGMYFSGTAGVRYFFSPTMAARAQLGFGITYLVLGLDFGL